MCDFESFLHLGDGNESCEFADFSDLFSKQAIPTMEAEIITEPRLTARPTLLCNALRTLGDRIEKQIRFTRIAKSFRCRCCHQHRSVDVCMACDHEKKSCECLKFLPEASVDGGYLTCQSCLVKSNMLRAKEHIWAALANIHYIFDQMIVMEHNMSSPVELAKDQINDLILRDCYRFKKKLITRAQLLYVRGGGRSKKIIDSLGKQLKYEDPDKLELMQWATFHTCEYLPANITGISMDCIQTKEDFGTHLSYLTKCLGSRNKRFPHDRDVCDVCALGKRLGKWSKVSAKKRFGISCGSNEAPIAVQVDHKSYEHESINIYLDKDHMFEVKNQMTHENLSVLLRWVSVVGISNHVVRKVTGILNTHGGPGMTWGFIWYIHERNFGKRNIFYMRLLATAVLDICGKTTTQRLNLMGLSRAHLDNTKKNFPNCLFVRWLYLVGIVPDIVAQGLLNGCRTTNKKACKRSLSPDEANMHRFTNMVNEINITIPFLSDTKTHIMSSITDIESTKLLKTKYKTAYKKIVGIIHSIADDITEQYGIKKSSGYIIDAMDVSTQGIAQTWANYLKGNRLTIVNTLLANWICDEIGTGSENVDKITKDEVIKRMPTGLPPCVIKKMLITSNQMIMSQEYEDCMNQKLKWPCHCQRSSCMNGTCEFTIPLPRGIPEEHFVHQGFVKGCNAKCPFNDPENNLDMFENGKLTVYGRASLCINHSKQMKVAEKCVRVRTRVETDARIWALNMIVERDGYVTADHILIRHIYGLPSHLPVKKPMCFAIDTKSPFGLSINVNRNFGDCNQIIRYSIVYDDRRTFKYVTLGLAGRTMKKVRRDRTTMERTDTTMKLVRDAQQVYNSHELMQRIIDLPDQMRCVILDNNQKVSDMSFKIRELREATISALHTMEKNVPEKLLSGLKRKFDFLLDKGDVMCRTSRVHKTTLIKVLTSPELISLEKYVMQGNLYKPWYRLFPSTFTDDQWKVLHVEGGGAFRKLLVSLISLSYNCNLRQSPLVAYYAAYKIASERDRCKTAYEGAKIFLKKRKWRNQALLTTCTADSISRKNLVKKINTFIQNV